MKFRTVSLPDVSSDDLARWRRLADSAIEPNPNIDPRFLYTSLGFGLLVEEIELAIVESEEDFVLLMAFTRARRLSGVPAPHLTTGGEFLSDHASRNHPLVCRGCDPVAAMRKLFRGLRAASLPDLVNLTVFPADGPLCAALETLHAEGTVRVIERARDRRAVARRTDLEMPDAEGQIERHGILDFPMPHLSRRKRRMARKNAEGIEALGGGPLRIAARNEDHELLNEFFELQAAGWKGDESKTGPQYRRWGREPWVRHVVGAFHADKNPQLWHVTAGEDTVYIALTFFSGGALFGFQDVFNERFKRYSPGTVGRLALLGAALHQAKVALLDPCIEPRYTQANSAYPSYREYVDLLVAGRSLRSRLIVELFPAAKRVRALAKGIPFAQEPPARMAQETES